MSVGGIMKLFILDECTSKDVVSYTETPMYLLELHNICGQLLSMLSSVEHYFLVHALV